MYTGAKRVELVMCVVHQLIDRQLIQLQEQINLDIIVKGKMGVIA